MRFDLFAARCLVQIPRFGNVPYAGLIHFERMHTFALNYCTYLMEVLVALVIDPVKVTRLVKRCHQFRDPLTGKTHPRLSSILKMTHYTAEKRVRAVFYWAHVLGTKADVITPDDNMRLHAQVAVSTLQLLLIATRGHRAYTEEELNTIFVDVGSQFFRSLEMMTAYLDRRRITNGNVAHQRNKTRVRKPRPYQLPNRSIINTCVIIFTHVTSMNHM